MKKFYKLFSVIGIIGLLMSGGMNLKTLSAANTSNFQQTINPGTLNIDIVDSSYVSVATPTVVMTATTFSFICQTITGTFGTASQQIYVRNPDAADGGWTASVAASSPTAIWDSTGTDYDFNDPTSSGCTDGGDADSFGGQMTVNATPATLSTGACLSCTTTSITKGSSTGFNEGTVNSITLLNAAAASSDIGDFRLNGVTITQTIPAEQPASSDYNINMVLSVVAI